MKETGKGGTEGLSPFCLGRVLQMAFDIRIITDCFKLSKKQIRELVVTIILPIAAAVTFIAPLWPSLIKDARTLNICLLGFVVALPLVLINNVVWSLLFCALIERVSRMVVTSYLLSSPAMKKNELVRARMQTFVDEMFDECPPFGEMRFEAVSSFYFRDIASVLTAIAFYMTAILICLFRPGTLISALLFLVLALLPPICAVLILNKVSSELQSTLAKMTHHEIVDQVSRFVTRHFSPDVVKQMESFVYGLLDGDPNTSLSEILDSRMMKVDRVLLELGGGETQEAQHE